jgi:hypothetical protein
MFRTTIDDITPIRPPMMKSHIVRENPFGRMQLRQNPPEGELELFATCIATDLLPDAAGLPGSVAVKFTINVWPAWLWLGVKEKVPDAGSKAMLGANPVALTFTTSVGASGFLA